MEFVNLVVRWREQDSCLAFSYSCIAYLHFNNFKPQYSNNCALNLWNHFHTYHKSYSFQFWKKMLFYFRLEIHRVRKSNLWTEPLNQILNNTAIEAEIPSFEDFSDINSRYDFCCLIVFKGASIYDIKGKDVFKTCMGR